MQFIKEYLGKGYLFESSLVQFFNEALEKEPARKNFLA